MSKTFYCITTKVYEDGTVLAAVTHKITAEEMPERRYASLKYYRDCMPDDTKMAEHIWSDILDATIGPLQKEGVTEIYEEWFDDITIAKNIAENIRWYHEQERKKYEQQKKEAGI